MLKGITLKKTVPLAGGATEKKEETKTEAETKAPAKVAAKAAPKAPARIAAAPGGMGLGGFHARAMAPADDADEGDDAEVHEGDDGDDDDAEDIPEVKGIAAGAGAAGGTDAKFWDAVRKLQWKGEGEGQNKTKPSQVWTRAEYKLVTDEMPKYVKRVTDRLTHYGFWDHNYRGVGEKEEFATFIVAKGKLVYDAVMSDNIAAGFFMSDSITAFLRTF